MNQKEEDKRGYQFNLAVKSQMESIIEPLKQILPITNFSYLRFYDDNRLLHIQPNQDLLKHLLKSNFNNQGLKNEKLHQAVQNTDTQSQFIWPSDSRDDLSRFLYTFDLKNTMSIITKKDSYIESLTFSNSLEEKEGADLNTNNKDIYKQH